MGNINFIINDFNAFGVNYWDSDMLQWDTWDLACMDKKNTSTETEYGEMMEEPHQDVDSKLIIWTPPRIQLMVGRY